MSGNPKIFLSSLMSRKPEACFTGHAQTGPSYNKQILNDACSQTTPSEPELCTLSTLGDNRQQTNPERHVWTNLYSLNFVRQ